MVTASAPAVASSDWKKMKVPELRDELASRGLDTTGVKAALIERLEGVAPKDVEDGSVAVDGEGKDMDLDINEDAPLETAEEKLVTEQASEAEPSVLEVDMTEQVPSVVENLQSADQTAEGNPAPLESAVEVVNGNSVTPSTDLEKKQRRAERFGLELMVSEGEKRRLRAARFGDTVDTKTNGNAKILPQEDSSKMSPTLKDAEAVKRKARAARFGIDEVQGKLSSSPTGIDDAKKKARLARFGLEIKPDPLQEEKKKLRAARFGLTTDPKPAVETETTAPVEQPVET